MDTVLAATGVLARDQFGNYVIQHVVQYGTPEQRSVVIGRLAPSVVSLAQHKFASNVVEKCLVHGSPADRELLVSYVLSRTSSAGSVGDRRRSRGNTSDSSGGDAGSGDGSASSYTPPLAGAAPPAPLAGVVVEDALAAMMKHQFGNYVVQKMLEVCTPQQQALLLARIRAQAPALRKYPYCKHILARVDRMAAAADASAAAIAAAKAVIGAP